MFCAIFSRFFARFLVLVAPLHIEISFFWATESFCGFVCGPVMMKEDFDESLMNSSQRNENKPESSPVAG